MSSAVKSIIGVVAAIAIPFAAPFIAGAIGLSGLVGGLLGSTALGSTLGSGLVGAALGAGASAATGQNIGRGALFGGIGGGIGGFLQGGGLSSLFDGGGGGWADTGGGGWVADGAATSVGSSAGGPALTTTMPQAVTPPAGVWADAGGGTWVADGAATSSLSGASTNIPAAELASVSPAGAVSSLGTTLSKGINPSALAQLAMVMYNRPPEGLTAAERAAVQETAGLAAQDRALFNQRVEQARAMINAGTPNPEQAFATVANQVERQAREATRGGTEFDERRAALERQRLGAGAVAQEAVRANQFRMAGLQAMPGQAPLGEASRVLPIYAASQRREDEYNRDLARAIGGGGMFGSRGLFG